LSWEQTGKGDRCQGDQDRNDRETSFNSFASVWLNEFARIAIIFCLPTL